MQEVDRNVDDKFRVWWAMLIDSATQVITELQVKYSFQ